MLSYFFIVSGIMIGGARAPPATPIIYSGTKNSAGRAESSLCPKGSLKDETPNHHFRNCKLYQDICVKYFGITKTTVHDVVTRGGVEDTRLEAKDNLYEDRPSRGQGPRTQPQVFSKKKKGLQKLFSGDLQFIGVPKIFNWERPKPQITWNDVIKNFPNTVFVGQRYRRMEDLKSLPVGT